MEINSKKEQKKEYYTSYLALFVNFNNLKKGFIVFNYGFLLELKLLRLCRNKGSGAVAPRSPQLTET